jgi:hypothetical protein
VSDSHYNFKYGFIVLRGTAPLTTTCRLLVTWIVVGLLTLSIGLHVEAIEAQAVLSKRAAQRVLLRLEPLPHRRHVGLDVRLQPAVLDSQ